MTKVVHRLADGIHHVTRFVAIGVAGVDGDRRALLALGPQFFAMTLRVARDKRVRGRENRRARAIIPLEPECGRPREVALEPKDDAVVRAPEAVNALIVVAHHADVARAS